MDFKNIIEINLDKYEQDVLGQSVKPNDSPKDLADRLLRIFDDKIQALEFDYQRTLLMDFSHTYDAYDAATSIHLLAAPLSHHVNNSSNIKQREVHLGDCDALIHNAFTLEEIRRLANIRTQLIIFIES